jgi:hypothetical protein
VDSLQNLLHLRSRGLFDMRKNVKTISFNSSCEYMYTMSFKLKKKWEKVVEVAVDDNL